MGLYDDPMFQAVSFMIADMAIGIEASRLLVHKAAYEIDQGRTHDHDYHG